MQTIRNRSIAALGAIVATFATVAASSPARAETAQAVVSLAGVELGSAHGDAILDRRIRNAAAQVCGPIDRTMARAVRACRRAAVSNAKASLPAATARLQLAAR